MVRLKHLHVRLLASLCITGFLFAVPQQRSSLAVHAASTTAQSLCIAHHPQDFVWYTHSCTGHDEPEIDPLSNKPGSAQNLTWTVVLPTDGATTPVDSVGPTFWIGGAVTDPN